jgi:hypothetical protein
MSDRAFGFEGAYNTAISEISCLRAEHRQVVLEAARMNETINRLRAEVERLKRHITEIEQLHREYLEEVEAARGVWITDEQIDKAWANRYGRCETRPGGYYGSVITLDAEDFGIVECPECEDSMKPGWVFKMDIGSGGDFEDCPRCHGHGWTREEHGE